MPKIQWHDLPSGLNSIKSKLAEQTLDELLSRNFKMSRDCGEHGRERSDPQRVVVGDRDVMLAVFERGQTDMAAALAGDAIAEPLERPRQVAAGEVPRQPQGVRTSSRT